MNGRLGRLLKQQWDFGGKLANRGAGDLRRGGEDGWALKQTTDHVGGKPDSPHWTFSSTPATH